MFFTSPTKLNGSELLAELAAGDIKLDRILLEGNNQLNLDINAKDKAKAQAIIEAHNGTVVAPEPTVAEKLASVGLNLDDLKIALGL